MYPNVWYIGFLITACLEMGQWKIKKSKSLPSVKRFFVENTLCKAEKDPKEAAISKGDW